MKWPTSAAKPLELTFKLLKARISVSLRRARTSASQSWLRARKMAGTAQGTSSLILAGGAETARGYADASTGAASVGKYGLSRAAVCSELRMDSSWSILRLSCRDGRSSRLSLWAPTCQFSVQQPHRTDVFAIADAHPDERLEGASIAFAL